MSLKMEINDLKCCKRPENYNLNEELFIYDYGYVNCRVMKFKDSTEVLNALYNAYPNEDFSDETKIFIEQKSNKEALCYLCHIWESSPDIFVCGENNTPFTVDCFV